MAPQKIPKNHGFQIFQVKVMANSWMIWSHRVSQEITIHVLRQGTIPAHEEATFPRGGQGPDLDLPGIAW